MKDEIICRQIEHNSLEYWETVRLRYDVLRVPLKLDYAYSALIGEGVDIHLAAFMNGKIVACLILTPVDGHQIKMRQVAVMESLQGKGIGKVLVEFSEKIAIDKGFDSIILNAREVAIPFYLNQNYEIYGELFTEVTIPHMHMRKQLQ